MTITTICSLCGKSMEHTAPDDMPEFQQKWAHKLAGCVVHKACRDNRWKNKPIARSSLDELWETKQPKRYSDTIIGKLPNKEAVAKVMAWAWNGNGLTLQGPTGHGKTRSLYLLLKREFFIGREIDCLTHSEFFAYIQRNWNEQQNMIQRKIKFWKSCDIFALDDLGQAKHSNGQGATTLPEDILWEILETRWNDRLPVFITTQVCISDLHRVLPAERANALVRRIQEFCPIIMFCVGKQCCHGIDVAAVRTGESCTDQSGIRVVQEMSL